MSASVRTTAILLDDEDDERVEDIDKEAGKVIGEGETVREAWRKHFDNLGGHEGELLLG